MTATATDITEAELTAQRNQARELAQNIPTRKNLTAFKKAEVALKQFMDAQLETADNQSFASLVDVVAHLDAEGWKISKSTAYEHRDDGKIRPGQDGRYTLDTVLEYARQHLQRKDGSPADDKGNLQEQKLLAEIRRISSDASLRDLKYKERQGELISRDHVEVELAARASDLKTHLDASARSSATRIIKLVGGDVQKAPELISFMLGINRKVMDNYSRPIQGPDTEEE